MQSQQQEEDDEVTAENFMTTEGIKFHNSSKLVRKEETSLQ
jgi:hypothetical protein